MEYKVAMWRRDDGSIPAADALAAMEGKSPNLKKKMLAKITQLKDKSNHGMPLTGNLETGIQYVRARAGHTWGRIFFIFQPDQKILLLSGFCKTTDTVPENEKTKVRLLIADVAKKEGGKK